MKSTRICRVILFMILCLLFTVPAFADVLTIPVGVKEIGEEAFYGDTSLDQVVLPEGIERIGPRAFWGSSLSFINLPASLEYIGDDALDPDADIEVTAVKGSKAYDWAVEKGFIKEQEESSSITFKFEDNGDGTCTVTGIKSLTFDSFSKDLVIPSYGLEGKPVTAIGERAFAGMREFKAGLVIPNSVTTIGDFAFAWCSGFTGNLTIPQSVTTIGNSAFSMCSGFTGNLTIPEKVTVIGEDAFRECTGFTGNLIIPDSVIRIEDAAFGGCSGLNGTLTIGKNVTYIGASAFEMCTKLTGHMVIPPSVKEMGSGAFYGCSGLEEITVSDGITYFDFNTISDCSGLKRLNLPDSLTSIKDFNYSWYITELPSDFTVYSGSECARKWAYENYVSFNGGAVDYTPQMKRFFAQATNIRGETELNIYLEMDIDFLTYPISDDFYEYRNSIKGYWGTSNDKSKAGLLDPYSSGISLGRRASVNGSYACGDYEGESCPEQIYLWFDMENSAGSVSYGPYRLDVQIRENELDNHLVYYPIDEATCSVAIKYAYEEEEIVIPDRAPDGRRVTYIKNNGFSFTDFSSVILPDSLIEIGYHAFGSMENITYISVPKHVKKIDDDVFKDCTALETVVLPESIEYIAGGYYPGSSYKPLFGGCTSLSAIYCVRDSYAWNWCAENGYEDLLVAWDGTADPRPEQEYLTGAFDEETVTVALGTKQQISGRVKSKGDPLSRVTVTILDYSIPDDSDRYASKSFEGQNLTEVSLADHEVFTLDTTREPLNTPGEYTIRLWASTEDGNGEELDSVQVNVVTKLAAPNITYPAADGDEIPYGDINVTWDPVPGAGYYVISLRELDTDELILHHYSIDDETSAVLSASYFQDDTDYRVAIGAVPAGFDSTEDTTGWKERVFHVCAEENSEYSLVSGYVYEEGKMSAGTLSNQYTSFVYTTSNGRYPSNNVTVEAYKIEEKEEDKPSAVAATDENGRFEMKLSFKTRYRLTFSKDGNNYQIDTIIFTDQEVMDLDDIFLKAQNMLEYGSVNLSGMQSGLFAEYFAYKGDGKGYKASSSLKRNEGTVEKVDFNWEHHKHETQNYNMMKDTVSGEDIRYIGEKFAARFTGYLSVSGLERSEDGTLYLRLIGDDGVKINLESGQYYCQYAINHEDWEKMHFWNNALTRITLSKLQGTETFKITIDYYNKGGTALLRMEYSNDGENWQTIPEYCFYNKGASAQRTVYSYFGEGLAVSTWLFADDVAMKTYSTISKDIKDSENLLHTAGSKLAISIQDWIRNTTYEALENEPHLRVIASANAGTEIKPTTNRAYQTTEKNMTDALDKMNGVKNYKEAIRESFENAGNLISSIKDSMSSKQKNMVTNINKVVARVCYREMVGELPRYGSTNAERMWEVTWQKAEEKYNNGAGFSRPVYSDSNSVEQMEYLCAYLYGTGNSAAKEAAGNILLKFAENSETIQDEYGYNLGDFMWDLCEKIPLLGSKVASLHSAIEQAKEFKQLVEIIKGDPEVARAMLSLAWSEMGDNLFKDSVLGDILSDQMKTRSIEAGNGVSMYTAFYNATHTYKSSNTKDEFDTKLDGVRDGSVITVLDNINGINPERIVHNELLLYSWKYMKQELTGMLNE